MVDFTNNLYCEMRCDGIDILNKQMREQNNIFKSRGIVFRMWYLNIEISTIDSDGQEINNN